MVGREWVMVMGLVRRMVMMRGFVGVVVVVVSGMYVMVWLDSQSASQSVRWVRRLSSCRWFYPVSYCASVCLMLGISSLSGLLLCVVFGPKILLLQRFSSMGYDEKVAKWFYCQTLHREHDS